MRNKMAFFVAAALVSTSALAQSTEDIDSANATNETTSTITLDSFRAGMQEAGFSLDFYNIAHTQRDDKNSINGYNNIIEAPLNWAFADNQDVRLYPSASISNTEGANTNANFDLLEFRYRRKNLLQESSDGITLNAEARIAAYPEAPTRRSKGNNGYAQARIVAAKTLPNEMALTALFRHYEFLKNSENAAKRDHYYQDITAALSSPIAGPWSASAEVNFFNAKNTESSSQGIGLEPSLAYALSSDVSASAYYEVTPFQSNDGQLLNSDAFSAAELGLVLSLNAF